MQHVYGIRTPGHIDHAVSAAIVRNANLLNTLANRGQRFEIVGLLPTLDLIQLIARVMPRVLGEVSQALERVAEKVYAPHTLIISNWI